MRRRSAWSIGPLALAWVACVDGTPPEKPAAVGDPRASACARAQAARARVPSLLAQGRLDRSKRVLDWADGLCPQDGAQSAELRQELSVALTDTRSVEELMAAALAAYRNRDTAEMQRSYDRAMARAEADAGEKMTLDLPLDAPLDRDFAWSPDSRWFASIQGDLVSVREQRLGFAETRRVGRWGAAVKAIAFSADNKTLAVATEDGHIRWIDTTSFTESKKLLHAPSLIPGTNIPDTLDALAFSADGRFFASARTSGGTGGGNILIWDAKTGAQLRPLEGTRDGGSELVFSRDGARLSTQTFQLGRAEWSVESGKLLGHESAPATEDFELVEKAAQRWQKKQGAPPKSVSLIALSADRSRAALTVDGAPTQVHFLDLQSLRATPLGTAIEPELFPPPEFAPNGEWLAVELREGLAIIDAKGGAIAVPPALLSDGPGSEVALSPDGTQLVTGSRVLRSWSLRVPTDLRVLATEAEKVPALAWALDGKRFASGRSAGVQLWDARGGRGAQLAHPGVAAIAFSPDGTSLVTGGSDVVRVWDLASGSEVLALAAPGSSWRTRVGVSLDGATLASTNERHKLSLWSLPSGKPVASLEGGPFAFTRKVSGLVYLAGDRVRRADTSTGAETGHWELGAGGASSLSLSDDGELAAIGAPGRSAEIWQLSRGARVASLADPDHGSVRGFLPGRRGLVTASADRVSFWSLTGAPLVSLRAMQRGQAGYAFAHDVSAIELFGPEEGAVRGALRCRAGTRVFQFELCRERFEVPGLVEASLSSKGYEGAP